MSDTACTDLQSAVARGDRDEVKRLARQLPNGQALPFLAELAGVIEVIAGQRSV
jgi:hypothetical protein